MFFVQNKNFISSLIEEKNTVFIVDNLVYNLYKMNILADIPTNRLILLEISEFAKNIETVCYLYDKIMQFAPKKNLTIVSIGGGITQDITGFVASSLYRGVNWTYIPTTLLAQVDSCIGAKTSLNYEHYKNLIGTFFPPSKVYIYPEFLKTLKREDFYSGVGEMAKLHLMSGDAGTKEFIKDLPMVNLKESITLLNKTLNCLKIKKSYIEEDEFDSGKRNMLNYGHCFGHAIESATDFIIPHGQAVVLGMILANKIAFRRGLLSQDLENYVYQNVLKQILVVQIPKLNIEKIISAMQQDKKNVGRNLALVMFTNNYNMVKITDLQIYEVKELLEECLQLN